jgi:hypothetical protein
VKIELKRYVFLAVILLLLTGPSALCDPLQGKLTVSKEIPAVPQDLKEGKIFKEENLPPMGTTQYWCWIPRWSAGTWHRETQTDFLPSGPHTEVSRTVNEQQRGHQVDNHGGIWNRISLPSKSTVESDQYINWQIATDSEPLTMNETQTLSRVRFVSIYVDRLSGKIVKVLQQEEVRDARPNGEGRATVDVHKTIYDENGKQLSVINSHADYSLIRPFSPVAVDPVTGIDLQKDLKNYLLSRGLNDLVPKDQIDPSQFGQPRGNPF